jgi:glycosidase
MIDREISATDFENRLKDVRESFPDEANYVVQNLMDSHDTPRLASMVLNPGREYDKEGTPEEGFDVRKPNEQERNVQRLIALLQFTYIGAPMIFYGTEAGMWGADDPDDRKPMVWPDREYETEKTHPLDGQRPADENSFNHDLYHWYKRLAQIRNEHEVLQTGKFESLAVDSEKNIYSFARFSSEEEYLVVVTNRSEHEQYVEIPLHRFQTTSGSFRDLISGEQIIPEGNTLKLTLPPVSGLILSP